MGGKFNKKVYVILVILLVLAVFLWTASFAQDNQLHIYFYDVGQGDAIYIRSPKGQDVIIDGGPDSTILSKLGRDMPFYDRKIELIILTHPHSDHFSGLIDILKRYNVDQILCSDIKSNSAAYKEWEDLVSEMKILKRKAEKGQQIYLGEAKIEILHAVNKDAEVSDLNDASIVSRLTFGQASVLLMGDAGQNVEKEILAQKNELKSNVLKIGHHGSKYSSSSEFLDKVRPQYAIISVGKGNKFGHPHNETLNRLFEINAKVLRTDNDGDIKCTSDGNKIECVASGKIDLSN